MALAVVGMPLTIYRKTMGQHQRPGLGNLLREPVGLIRELQSETHNENFLEI